MNARRSGARRHLRLPLLLVAVLAVVVGVAGPAAADPDISGEDGGVVVKDDDTSTDQTGGDGGGGGDTVIRIPKPYKEYKYVPACSANTVDNGGDWMCGGSTACPEPGDIRYRVYTRQHDADGEVADGADWEDAGVECRGPNDPPEGGPVQITIADIADEARKAAPATVVQVQPATKSFVNVPTNFFADTAPLDATVTVLGQTIGLRFVPSGFAWTYGDGATGTGPGVKGAAVGAEGAVEHAYGRSGDVAVTLTRTFDVTYTLPGGVTGALPAPGISNTSVPYPLEIGEVQSLVTNDR